MTMKLQITSDATLYWQDATDPESLAAAKREATKIWGTKSFRRVREVDEGGKPLQYDPVICVCEPNQRWREV